jgi:hypothetical protein
MKNSSPSLPMVIAQAINYTKAKIKIKIKPIK